MGVLRIAGGLIGLGVMGYFNTNLPQSWGTLLLSGVVFGAPSMSMIWEGGKSLMPKRHIVPEQNN